MANRGSLFSSVFGSAFNSALGKLGLRQPAGIGPGVLTPASITPVPLVAFSTAVAGLTPASTRTATSSDGTVLTLSGAGVLSGKWTLNKSGTFPTITIVEAVPGVGSKTSTFGFAVATLWTPALAGPTSRLRFDTGLTKSATQLASIVSSGSIGGTFTGNADPYIGTDAAATSQPNCQFNGSNEVLNAGSSELAASKNAPGMAVFAVFRPGATLANSPVIYNSANTGSNTRVGLYVENELITLVSRAVDSGSASTITSAITLTSGALTLSLAEYNLPAGTGELRTNGAVDSTGAITSAGNYPNTASATVSVGAIGASTYCNHTLLEVAQFQGILSTTTKQLIEGYAALRYTCTVPPNHPFYSYPPTVLGLSNLTATHAAAWSAQISGLPPGATGVTASSSDGTPLTVASGVVSGTFAAASSPTISLAAAYNGVPLSGSAVVTVS